MGEAIKGFERIASQWYPQYVAPSTVIPKEVGNCYTASIFMGLMSLIVDQGQSLIGKEIQMFSYGSGTMASLYSLKVHESEFAKKSLLKMVENNEIVNRLRDRTKTHCGVYTEIMNQKQDRYRRHSARGFDGDFVPQSIVDIDHFYPETFYLERIDSKKRRFYAKFESVAIEEEEEMKCDAAEEIEIKQRRSATPVLVMKEEEVQENIARFKSDGDEENESKFEIQSVGHFIGDAVLIGAQKVLDKAQDHGLGKKGAIQIDKVLTKTHQVATRCSNS